MVVSRKEPPRSLFVSIRMLPNHFFRHLDHTQRRGIYLWLQENSFVANTKYKVCNVYYIQTVRGLSYKVFFLVLKILSLGAYLLPSAVFKPLKPILYLL